MNIKEILTNKFPNNSFDILTNKDYMIVSINNDRSFKIKLEELYQLHELSQSNLASFQDEVINIITNNIRPFIK